MNKENNNDGGSDDHKPDEQIDISLELAHRLSKVGHSQFPRYVSVSHDDGMILTLCDTVRLKGT